MRLDLFLKISRLVPRRTVAKDLCDAGAVQLNRKAAKASAEVAPGQLLTLSAGGRVREVEILEVPSGRISRKEAPGLYLVRREYVELEPQLF